MALSDLSPPRLFSSSRSYRSVMSPNGSVDIHVNGADDFQLDSCAPRSLFPLSNCHLKSILSITPRRVLSANCSLYGWAELIAEMFPLSGEALNTGKLVGCVSSSLPAAALLQQQLNNSEQHSTPLHALHTAVRRLRVQSSDPDWADLLWKEHVMIVVKPNTQACSECRNGCYWNESVSEQTLCWLEKANRLKF